MTRGKKKDAAQAAPAPEITVPTPEAPETTPAPQEPEAHLDPGQFEDMDDATLQGLAQDLGLDPAAYEDRDALIAAIAALPVIPGPPEGEAEQPDPAPAPQEPEPTADPEPVPAQEDPAPAPQEPEPTADPEPVPAQEDPAPAPEPNPEATPGQDPEPEPDPAGERHTPYKATVAVSLAVVHKEVGLGTAEMLKAVGSLRQGTTVTVTGRKGTYAQLKNGLYILEAFLEVLPTD